MRANIRGADDVINRTIGNTHLRFGGYAKETEQRQETGGMSGIYVIREVMNFSMIEPKRRDKRGEGGHCQ